MSTAGASSVDFAALTERFVAAQLSGDRVEASRLLAEEGIARGARVIDLQARVIRAAQYEIGLLWQRNRVSIAQEHLATGIAQLAMARLFEHVTPTPRNGVIVAVGCVEGELHDFPARLVADYLDHAGFIVRYFGANLPTSEVVALVKRERPSVLALSTTMSFNVPALRDAVRRVRAELDAKLPIIVGGHALQWSPDLMTDLGVETASADPDDVTDAVRRLTGTS
jgi:MerR family transcriptional regulator, light-induced transcriptional regulator